MTGPSSEVPARRPEARNTVSGVLRRPAFLLLIDKDRVARRFVELAFSKSPSARHWIVEAVSTAVEARDYLGQRVVDLIISETELPDMNAIQLFRHLSEASQLNRIPFLLFSADGRPATKHVAFSAGVDDYVVKPCDPIELTARADALVGRERRVRFLLRRKNYTLAGDLATLAFPDLVSMLEMLQRSGVLAIATSRAQGEVFFDQGRVVHAIFGNVSGEWAFYQLMAQSQGTFEFVPEQVTVSPTIVQTGSWLLMEGARLLDTERAGDSSIGLLAGLAHRQGEETRPSLPGRVPALRPTASLVSAFTEGLRDPFMLGEMRYFTRMELEGWTRAPVGRDRVHVLLMADLRTAIGALLPLAGAPGERFVATGLTSEPKTLGLSFHLRQERVLDVLLLEIRNPAAALDGLARQPAVVIVAPPDGDFLAIGSRGRADLDRITGALLPPAILGVGHAQTQTHLRELPALRGTRTRVRNESGALGNRDMDFRNLLLEAVELWGETGGGV